MTRTMTRTMTRIIPTLGNREDTENGFTMIEILVVIIIIGILAAVAIPIFLNQRQAARDSAVVQDARNVGTVLMGRAESVDRTYLVSGKGAPIERIPDTAKWWNEEFPEEPLIVSEGTILEIAFNPWDNQSSWGYSKSERNDICVKVGNHQAGKYKGVQWGQHDKAENFAWFDSRSGGVQTAQQIYEESVAGGEPSACYVAGFKYAKENNLPAPPDPRDYKG